MRLAILVVLAAPGLPGEGRSAILEYFARLERPDGGYGWEGEPTSHLTPTWAAIEAHRILGADIPRRAALAGFVREGNPLTGPHSETRPHAADLRSFTVQQIWALKALGEDPSPLADVVGRWNRAPSYPAAYERNRLPIFQQEAMVFIARGLLGLPAGDVHRELSEYLESRRRPDGSFNNTPAADGSGGNILNTLWGLRALGALGRLEERRGETIAWIRSCQRPSGGFTHAPGAVVGAVEGMDYTRAAVLSLRELGAVPADPAGCIRWILSLWNADGGFGQRPGWPSDPVCTLEALETLLALGALGDLEKTPRRVAGVKSIPDDLRPFTIQIQAPGQGSPEEAVELARVLRIHLWGAKNSPAGWIEQAQAAARRRNVPVTFFVANEEYGTWVSLPGQGTYSHLSDPIAPAGVDFGPPMTGRDVPWEEFRDRRLGPLRRAGGRMVWQICDNEEFSRILLDDSLERGGYAALSTFHMRQNFAAFLPWLYRYRGVIPFVTLQDAHGVEPWWWTDDLASHRTVFLAREPTWEAWLEALEKNWVVSIRHDEVTRYRTRILGGAPGVREIVLRHEDDWRWWGERPGEIRRPLVSIVAVRPGDRFEAGRPERGVGVRVRTAWSNNPAGAAVQPLAELVGLAVDGVRVPTRRVERRGEKGRLEDVYEIAELPGLGPGRHVAVATVRRKNSGEESRAEVQFEIPGGNGDGGSSLSPPVLRRGERVVVAAGVCRGRPREDAEAPPGPFLRLLAGEERVRLGPMEGLRE